VDTRGAEVEVFALAALYDGAADLSMPVPSCPGWTLRDLAEHVGGVHRWAAHHVRVYSPVRVPANSIGLSLPGDDAEVADWLREGAAVLVSAFEGADGDVAMWAWGADKHARFWPRRMLHETAVHRADAALALGLPFALAGEVAADGIDELLDNLPCASYFAPAVDSLRGAGETLAFVAPSASWAVTLEADGFSWSRGGAQGSAPGSASVTLRAGSEADLLLMLYGRLAPGDVSGDRAVLDRWLAGAAL
jgi:uncharacterized protein (TIGR03083 family)